VIMPYNELACRVENLISTEHRVGGDGNDDEIIKICD
jgi:hypothetical protein